jgi:hypothetical protein
VEVTRGSSSADGDPVHLRQEFSQRVGWGGGTCQQQDWRHSRSTGRVALVKGMPDRLTSLLWPDGLAVFYRRRIRRIDHAVQTP